MRTPLIVFALAAAGPALAQTAPAPAPAAVTIPFDPPLGQPFVLKIDRVSERTVPGTPPRQASGTSRDELTFTERTADGYVLRWRSLAATSGVPEAAAIIGRISEALRATPVELATDATGAPTTIRNWPAVSAAFRGAAAKFRTDIPGRVKALPAAEQARAREALEGAARAMENYTAEQTMRTLLRETRLVLGYGGLALGGAPVTRPAKLEAAVLDAELAATRTFTLRRRAAGTATVVTTTRADAGAVSKAVDGVIARQLASVPEAQRMTARAQMERARALVIEDGGEVTLDLATGLPRAAMLVRTTGVPEVGTQTDRATVRIEGTGPA